jgi:hypothetical protein
VLVGTNTFSVIYVTVLRNFTVTDGIFSKRPRSPFKKSALQNLDGSSHK